MSTHDATPQVSGPMKERLIEAALDELRELDPTALLHAIGARAIATRAGASSPASINQHYGSLAGLADAVVTRVFDTKHLNVPSISELITHIKDSTLPLPVAFAMHEAEFNRLTSDDEFKLRVGLWSLGGEAVNTRYREYLRETDLELEAAASALFESWGRELRPPTELHLYMALKIALLHGITVRQLADPDERRMHLFQRATVAIDLVLLRVIGDRHDLDARLSEMNYYPLTKKAQRTSKRSRQTVARILRTANELFSTQGYEATGIDQIAKNADTSLTTLKRYYPTKQLLAVALFHLHAANEPALSPKDESDDALASDLSAHLSALANFARARPAITGAYISHLANPSNTHDDALLTRTRSHLATTDNDTAEALAEALILLTLRRALTHLSEPTRDVATHTLSLINH